MCSLVFHMWNRKITVAMSITITSFIIIFHYLLQFTSLHWCVAHCMKSTCAITRVTLQSKKGATVFNTLLNLFYFECSLCCRVYCTLYSNQKRKQLFCTASVLINC
uniref:Uncharacterized protein n=1 Tax=Rhipicephalus microplus TaxID=6941 RepID=A0A6G5AFK3_RHIMP